MVKQVAAAGLWFFTLAWGWNYVAALTGLPSVAGLVLGGAAAAFVATDPFHVIWAKAPAVPSPPESRQVTVTGAISSRI